MAILGPSGCGKTTLLKVIAGLLEPDAGTVHFDGKDVTRLPPQRRKIGYVFQSLALFPHMTVQENIGFPLDARAYRYEEIERRVRQVLELTNLKSFERRYPRELSGGQQQRVALARAIVAEAQLLLLDEPLASLDSRLRASLLSEIRRIQQETGITTLYVTHDQGEAFSIGHKVMVMFDGKVEAIGEPYQVFAEPSTTRAAVFLGFTNRLTATILGESSDCIEAELCGGRMAIPRRKVRTHGGVLHILFRPESARMSFRRESTSQVEGTLAALFFEGRNLRARVRTEQGEIETSLPEQVSYLLAQTFLGRTVYVELTIDEVMLS